MAGWTANAVLPTCWDRTPYDVFPAAEPAGHRIHLLQSPNLRHTNGNNPPMPTLSFFLASTSFPLIKDFAFKEELSNRTSL